MVKLFFLCQRRADITHERYTELLLNGHVPLAVRHHPALRRYVVNIVDASPPNEMELDSAGELSFDSLTDFREHLYDSAEGQRIIECDVRGFMGAAHAYATTEYVQKAPATLPPYGTRTPGIKLVCPVMRRAGLSHAEFVDHWLTRHVPLALRHHSGLSKYVTNVVDARVSSSGELWDGIAELHFPSAEALANGMFDSPDGERIIRADIARFIGRTFAYRASEYTQKA